MLLLAPLIVALILLAMSLRIAQEYERAIVFRLGRYTGTRGPGLYWLIPFIERQQTIRVFISCQSNICDRVAVC